jgi:hypothetical protein
MNLSGGDVMLDIKSRQGAAYAKWYLLCVLVGG